MTPDSNVHSPALNSAARIAIPANNLMQGLQGSCESSLYGTSSELVTDPTVAPNGVV